MDKYQENPAGNPPEKLSFSLEYLCREKEFTFDYFTARQKAQKEEAYQQFFEKLESLSKLSWQDLDSQNKQTGYEKLKYHELKFRVPEAEPFLTQNMVIVFRFGKEQKYRMIGFRKKGSSVFYLMGFDFDFEAYNHGS